MGVRLLKRGSNLRTKLVVAVVCLVRSWGLMSVLEKAKILKMKGCATTYIRLEVRAGDLKESV